MDRPQSFIAFEGGVCAGKTAVLTRLATMGLGTVVPEYVDWLYQSQRDLPVGTSYDKLVQYFRVETERADAVDSGTGQYLIDRSFLTLVAHEYASLRLGLSNAWNHIRAASAGARLIVPTHVFFFDCREEVRRLRWQQRGYANGSLYVDEQFNRRYRDFFDLIGRRLNVNFVDSSAVDEVKLSDEIAQNLLPFAAQQRFDLRDVLSSAQREA